MNDNWKNNQTLKEIEKTKLKYVKLANINRIIEDQASISKDDKINTLTIIIKNMLEEASKSEKNEKVLKDTISHLNEQLSIQNKMIQRYKVQMLQSKDQYFKLKNEFKHLNNALQQTKSQILMKNQAIENEKYVSTKKVLSMQSQVNFLLSKDCKKQMERGAAILKKKLSVGNVKQQNLAAVDKKFLKSESKHKSQKKNLGKLL